MNTNESPHPIDPGVRIGQVHMKAADREGALRFWDVALSSVKRICLFFPINVLSVPWKRFEGIATFLAFAVPLGTLFPFRW